MGVSLPDRCPDCGASNLTETGRTVVPGGEDYLRYECLTCKTERTK